MCIYIYICIYTHTILLYCIMLYYSVLHYSIFGCLEGVLAAERIGGHPARPRKEKRACKRLRICISKLCFRNLYFAKTCDCKRFELATYCGLYFGNCILQKIADLHFEIERQESL